MGLGSRELELEDTVLLRLVNLTYFGMLRSRFCSFVPLTLSWSSSAMKFVKQMVLFDTQPSSSSRNRLFLYKWSIMPLIEIALNVYALYVPCV